IRQSQILTWKTFPLDVRKIENIYLYKESARKYLVIGLKQDITKQNKEKVYYYKSWNFYKSIRYKSIL
ncbi:hypothetical protein Q8G71_36745, partial [Klebsiella pneumoniae]